MLFNSIDYLCFFPAVVLVYYLIPFRWRWVLLLLASYYFYMCWKAEYLLLILFSTLNDYFAALKMEASDNPVVRKRFLLLSLTGNLGILFAFKYLNFFNQSIHSLLAHFNLLYNLPIFHVLLPVGISFYTFQSISYTVDVYRRKTPAEHHLGYFALYVSFFPQLLAGPIERSHQMLPQFRRRQAFDSSRVLGGMKLMLWGFFKKIVIADRLAHYVDTVYGHPEWWQGGAVLLANYFFFFQIYADFSGYSDIAIGSAQILGFRLNKNFDQPFSAQSIGEFWRRWHITAMTLFRDYVYYPMAMGGREPSLRRVYFATFLVYVVVGIWHGASWNFVAWGVTHGTYMVVSLLTRKFWSQFWKKGPLRRFPLLGAVIRVLFTFHLSLFALVFFRSETFALATEFLRRMATHPLLGGSYLLSQSGYLELLVALLSVLTMLRVESTQSGDRMLNLWSDRPTWNRWTICLVLLFSILIVGKFDEQPFIYFKF